MYQETFGDRVEHLCFLAKDLNKFQAIVKKHLTEAGLDSTIELETVVEELSEWKQKALMKELLELRYDNCCN